MYRKTRLPDYHLTTLPKTSLFPVSLDTNLRSPTSFRDLEAIFAHHHGACFEGLNWKEKREKALLWCTLEKHFRPVFGGLPFTFGPTNPVCSSVQGMTAESSGVLSTKSRSKTHQNWSITRFTSKRLTTVAAWQVELDQHQCEFLGMFYQLGCLGDYFSRKSFSRANTSSNSNSFVRLSTLSASCIPLTYRANL